VSCGVHYYDNHNHDHKIICTTTKEVKPDPDTVCIGPDCGIMLEDSANATHTQVFQMGNLVHNNLGGKALVVVHLR